MDHPVLGDYPQDANPAGGPLKFYVAFDGTSDDVLKNFQKVFLKHLKQSQLQ